MPDAAPRPLILDVAELCKLRVNVLVAVTASIGFLLGTPKGGPIDAGILSMTLFGTFLLACASATWNQVYERKFDSLMARTVDRPVAAGRIGPRSAAIGGGLACLGGIAGLALFVNPMTACVGALTVFVYICLYTPLKRRTPISLLVGAVAGALPPVMGWTATGASISSGAWILFGILFFWQVPHFHAIAWLYKDDYRDGGFKTLAVVRPSGREVAWESIVHALLLVLVTLLPAFLGLAHDWLLWTSGGFGALFLLLTLVFAKRRDRPSSRWLLYYSLIYLPAILVLWVLAAE